VKLQDKNQHVSVFLPWGNWSETSSYEGAANGSCSLNLVFILLTTLLVFYAKIILDSVLCKNGSNK
jgi:hypothetical protein